MVTIVTGISNQPHTLTHQRARKHEMERGMHPHKEHTTNTHGSSSLDPYAFTMKPTSNIGGQGMKDSIFDM
jgi:hypothetical protein